MFWSNLACFPLFSFAELHPAGKITEKPVWRSVFLSKWHCILNADSTKTHSSGSDFAGLADLPDPFGKHFLHFTKKINPVPQLSHSEASSSVQKKYSARLCGLAYTPSGFPLQKLVGGPKSVEKYERKCKVRVILVLVQTKYTRFFIRSSNFHLRLALFLFFYCLK